MKQLLAIILFLALLAMCPLLYAEQPTKDRCEALLSQYVRLKIDVEQAGLALNVQKGVVDLCNKLIEAEQPKPTPEPEEAAK